VLSIVKLNSEYRNMFGTARLADQRRSVFPARSEALAVDDVLTPTMRSACGRWNFAIVWAMIGWMLPLGKWR